MSTQHAIELRKRLDDKRLAVDAAVKENFGYCPDDPFFDVLLSDMRSLENELKALDQKAFDEYAEKHY